MFDFLTSDMAVRVETDSRMGNVSGSNTGYPAVQQVAGGDGGGSGVLEALHPAADARESWARFAGRGWRSTPEVWARGVRRVRDRRGGRGGGCCGVDGGGDGALQFQGRGAVGYTAGEERAQFHEVD